MIRPLPTTSRTLCTLAGLATLWGPTVACAAPSLAVDPSPPGEEEPSGGPETVERHLALMGTALTLVVEAPDRPTALAASEGAVRALETAEERLTTWEGGGELDRLNHTPVGQDFTLSPELARELAVARRWWRETEGAFDPGVGGLVQAWGLRSGGRRPDPAELAAALDPGGLGSLTLEGRTARRRHPDLVLEEGGFGKGAGLDAALTALGEAGATRAVLDLGGQVALLGGSPPERFALAHPDRREQAALEVTIDHGSLATSGNAERPILVDGEPLGHLLDPRSGEPAPDFGSLTVWADDALTADCLSTALFVLGPDAALAWAATHPGVEVLVLERAEEGQGEGEGLRARASAGLRDRVTPLDEILRLTFDAAPPTGTPQESSALPPPQDGADSGQDVEQRLRELEQRFEALSEDLESFQLGDVIPPPGDTRFGLGPAASKVYFGDGLSIGGYGEARYRNFAGGTPTDEFDLHRSVLYFGYKFDERWVFNSEIEIEHADEAFVEFAYIDYLHDDSLAFRGGMLLAPMGLVNEFHEPTTFLPANRSLTESYIIPSTWRENGVGMLGEVGGFDYKLYVLTGFDGTGFGGVTGLRDGRQKGSRAAAEDFALVGSLDWTATPGLRLGASFYSGDAGQEKGAGNLETSIFEAHAQYRSGPFWGRALVADATVDERNAGDLDLGGWYVEMGWDLLGASDRQALYPFLRYEHIDTDVSAGGIDDETLTLGLHYRPIDQVVLKLDHTDYRDDAQSDVTTFLIGYVF